jgi:hypothetical protein
MAIPRNLANIAPHVNASSTELVINDGSADLDFRVESDGNANMLFVDAGNNRVGIGTSSPAKRLDVSYSSTSATPVDAAGFQIINTENDTGYYSGVINFCRINSTTPMAYIGSIQISTVGNSANALVFGTRDGAATVDERARITSSGYFKASNTGGYLDSTGSFHEFRSNAADQPIAMTYALSGSYSASVIDSRAERNTTNNSFYAYSYFNGTPGSYTARFRVADSGNVTNTNNSYGSISDVKLKQDIVDAGSQWDDIKNLRVRKYRWKSDPDGFMQMGLVAQEAELVSPGLIDEHPDYEEVEVPVLDDEGNAVLNEDGTPKVTKERNALGTTTKAVKYSVLYMKAVKALQEAIERIETLEAKVAQLEANNP